MMPTPEVPHQHHDAEDGLFGATSQHTLKAHDRLPDTALPSAFVPSATEHLLGPVRREVQRMWQHTRQQLLDPNSALSQHDGYKGATLPPEVVEALALGVIEEAQVGVWT